MEALTRFVVRWRWAVVVVWFAVLVVSALASSRLSDLLTNRFTLPGTDTRQAEVILEDHFGQSTDGTFTVVVETPGPAETFVPQVRVSASKAAAAVKTGKLVSVAPIADDVVSATIVTRLDPAEAKGYTDEIREAVANIPGAMTYVTGQPAIEHDLDPVFERDLFVGEVLIAVPIALVLLVFTFGTLAFLVPFVFALVTIPTTLGLVWVFANVIELNTYITNMVSLIGLGIAIDYSLLVVYRFREEIRSGKPVDDAIVKTMETAGRAVVFSGTAVAIGLALLLFMPLPFMRGFGVAGLLLPLVSVVAALTLLPAMLSLVGGPLERVPVLPRAWLERPADHEHGLSAVLARSIMRR